MEDESENTVESLDNNDDLDEQLDDEFAVKTFVRR